MREALLQTFQNLWAHKLRSFLTMFGILWGVISVVILSATGEGFRQGNERVLKELGKNITDILAQAGGLKYMARELGVSEAQVASGAAALPCLRNERQARRTFAGFADRTSRSAGAPAASATTEG